MNTTEACAAAWTCGCGNRHAIDVEECLDCGGDESWPASAAMRPAVEEVFELTKRFIAEEDGGE